MRDGVLTDEQRRALHLAGRGLDTFAVAVSMGVPVERAGELLAEAAAALGAGSKLEAVVRAHQRGLLRA